jgi:2'-hydroxyisoflavone reductase
MVGPRDQSDRFTYWVRRLSAGGAVLAPGDPDSLVQIIDARDLARWIADMVERRVAGVYNATGPARPLTFGELLLHCQRQSERMPELRWVSDEELADAGIEPGNDLPLWVPKADAEGWGSISSAKAQQQGLNGRQINLTIAETLQWDRQRGSPPLKCGLTLEREHQLLSAFGR